MNVAYDFSDQVILVTGAGSGIGRAVALAFSRAGALVVAAGRGQAGVDETVELIRKSRGVATGYSVDVGDYDQVRTLIKSIVEQYGRLDIAHNNAGIFIPPKPIAELENSAWSDVMSTNLNGIFYCMKEEILVMREAGKGVIINTSSNIGGHSRRRGFTAYAASKSAVSTLTAAAALDHIGDGIRINAVSPGATATRMSLRPGETDDERSQRLAQVVPIGRVGQVDEIANTVLWLASRESSFVVGQDIVVDGGVTA